MKTPLMVVSVGPCGDYHWQAQPECELIDPVNNKKLLALHCYNPTQNPLTVRVVRTETGAIEFENNILSFPHWAPHWAPLPAEKPQLPEPEFSLSEINQACEYLQSTKSKE